MVVVMRVTTLKATAAKLPGLLAYYAGLAEDREQPGPGRGPVDYYLDPDEPPGRWRGGGRHSLGLEGNVESAEFRSLLEGAHPETGARLGRRFGDSSARGFDATFSASKSVSVLWALSPDPFPEEVIFVRSDQYAFVRRGIPAVYLDGGLIAPDGSNRGRAELDDFLRRHYHQPSDEIDLPIHYASAARLADLNHRIGLAVASDDDVPRWHQGDFFGRRFGGGSPDN